MLWVFALLMGEIVVLYILSGLAKDLRFCSKTDRCLALVIYSFTSSSKKKNSSKTWCRHLHHGDHVLLVMCCFCWCAKHLVSSDALFHMVWGNWLLFFVLQILVRLGFCIMQCLNIKSSLSHVGATSTFLLQFFNVCAGLLVAVLTSFLLFFSSVQGGMPFY